MDTVMKLFILIGLLMSVTNVIVQVVKKVTWDKIPTNIVVVIVAEALSLISFFGWASFTGFTILWYWIAAVIVIGLCVAYAAMFGFDKLKEALAKFDEIK